LIAPAKVDPIKLEFQEKPELSLPDHIPIEEWLDLQRFLFR
jgi:hypothetical protein